MIQIDPDKIAERFMTYARIDTQSDPESKAHPTTEKQKDLSRLLADQLRGFGLTQVETDQFGFVYATIPATTDKRNVPAVTFCAHVDTAPDCSGTNVKPIYHKNYDGSDIILPDDPTQILSPKNYPYLKNHIGKGVVTASGLTLLGADDKAGVAVIMTAVEYMIKNPAIKHGEIKIVFTPDEEVGQGTTKIDMKKLAPFGYTLDGGELGELEDETFHADAAIITIEGIAIHPGFAKGIMVNAIKVASAIIDTLPRNEWCPEATEGRQGFVHPTDIKGALESATLSFIVRDHDLQKLGQHHDRLKKIAEETVKIFSGARMKYEIREQYRNMKLILDQHPQVMAFAAEAIERAGVKVIKALIRGGTDGSKLSYMGMPCPNIFTGMQNFHGRHEWVGSYDMAKSAETIIHLAMVWEEKS
jgi:tripeptide aminopeptidase